MNLPGGIGQSPHCRGDSLACQRVQDVLSWKQGEYMRSYKYNITDQQEYSVAMETDLENAPSIAGNWFLRVGSLPT